MQASWYLLENTRNEVDQDSDHHVFRKEESNSEFCNRVLSFSNEISVVIWNKLKN